MNILVFGLGALGTVYSCLLKESGNRVIGLAREPKANIIREEGVRISGIWGDHASRLDLVVSGIEEINEEQFDIVLVTVKSYATGTVAREIAELVRPGTFVILLQNGYGNYESAVEYLPKKNLILGRVIFGAETITPGKSRVTVIADDVVLGSPENAIELSVIEDIALIFNRVGIPTRASDEVMKYIWGKITYNSALNPLGALFNVEYGKLAETEYTRLIMEDIINEIFDLLEATGQKTLWPDAQSYKMDFYNKMIPTTASHHSSMLQDITMGRRTEIDALNGAVVALGRKHGVPTPVNEVITRMIKARENMG